MTFDSKYVPASFTAGSYAVTLNTHGTENGVPFAQAVPLTGSNVLVQTPSAVAEVIPNALSPHQVSKTTTATFSVQFQNTGGATVVLNPATTTIKFASNQYSATQSGVAP